MIHRGHHRIRPFASVREGLFASIVRIYIAIPAFDYGNFRCRRRFGVLCCVWSREAVVVCGSASGGVTTVLRGTGRGNVGALWQLSVGPLANLPGPFHCAARGVMSWPDGSPLDTDAIVDKGFNAVTGKPDVRHAIVFSHEVVLLKANVGVVKVRTCTIVEREWYCARVEAQ